MLQAKHNRADCSYDQKLEDMLRVSKKKKLITTKYHYIYDWTMVLVATNPIRVEIVKCGALSLM